MLSVASVVVVYVYLVLLDAYAGTTVGKRILGLRVTGPSGGKPDVRQAAFLLVSAVVEAIPFIGETLGWVLWIGIAVTITNSPVKQGKHDQIAGGTRVVKVWMTTKATGPA